MSEYEPSKYYYELMGISPDASAEELKKRHRFLSAVCHTDRHPGDETAKFLNYELNEAYDVLRDPDKSFRYRHDHAIFLKHGPANMMYVNGYQDGYSRSSVRARAESRKIMEAIMGGDVYNYQAASMPEENRKLPVRSCKS